MMNLNRESEANRAERESSLSWKVGAKGAKGSGEKGKRNALEWARRIRGKWGRRGRHGAREGPVER